MLKHWYLRNFKSFVDLPPLSLSMVNVLAGANSSGKSTLIQSILLLKQTLQYGAEDRPITLNGPLLRMGSFEDVSSFGAKSEEIAIGFDIKVDDEVNGPQWARSSNYSFQNDGSMNWKSISVGLTFGLPKQHALSEAIAGTANLNPELAQVDLRVSGVTPGGETMTQASRFDISDRGRWPYTTKFDWVSENEIKDGRPEASVEGGFISHFLPQFVAVRYNQTNAVVSSLVDGLFRSSNALLRGSVSSDETISHDAVSVINQWLLAHNAEAIPESGQPVAISEVQAKLSALHRPWNLGLARPSELSESRADIAKLKEDLKSILIGERTAEYKMVGGQSKSMTYASNFLADFFKFGVRYLGPLRDSPRPVYQPEALESSTVVGYRGEHTAAVFEINKKSGVQYRLPPSAETDQDYVELAPSAHHPLEVACANWLEYLGVASNVETMDAGVFGNRMRVSIEGGAPLHDLTNVGVGVSQVLPIVVMALLAPRGSLLIFEQPELHLHPKVQARLGDFFLSLAIDGKQTLLETHSEYLVDRLRLRIAMSPTDEVRPLVNILFSEKVSGVSRMEPVEISEYGSILNWPKDFFEQSQQDVGRIIQAASRKRKSKSKKQ